MDKLDITNYEKTVAKKLQFTSRDYNNLIDNGSIWGNPAGHLDELESIEEQLQELAGEVGNQVEQLKIHEGKKAWQQWRNQQPY